MLKILYAAEDEKVEVSANGELTITAPNGEQVQGEIPAEADAAQPGDDNLIDGGDDQPMD